MPRHFCDGASSKITSWDDFKAFCDRCERIYDVDGKGLIYVENVEGKGQLHFSKLRGADVDIASIKDVHDDICKYYKIIFGWIYRRNKGLQRIVEQCGLKFTGLEMRHKISHGKIMIWDCYANSL